MKKGINVLSCFDGMSCGRIALERAGIKVDKYYASEIDRPAIQVSKSNYPDIIQLGDIEKFEEWKIDWSSIDLVIGGSPCQGFSIAGKQLNFEDPRSKLFFTFVKVCEKVGDNNPKMKFLLENVRMKQQFQDVISSFLGVKPVFINSSLVSAQKRSRLYWTNIGEIEQPEDKGVTIKDILLEEFDEKYIMSKSWVSWLEKKADYLLGKDYVSVNTDKGVCMTARMYANWNGNFLFIEDKVLVKEATKKGFTEIKDGECVDLTFINSKTRRGRNMSIKSNCLTATNYDYCQFKIDEMDRGFFRKLTPVECERLQTVPDNYTACVSDSERYKMLGNGWTVDVIAHIFKGLKDNK